MDVDQALVESLLSQIRELGWLIEAAYHEASGSFRVEAIRDDLPPCGAIPLDPLPAVELTVELLHDATHPSVIDPVATSDA